MQIIIQFLSLKRCTRCKHNKGIICTRADNKGEKCRNGKGLFPPGFENKDPKESGELEELVYKSDVLEAVNSCGGCGATDPEDIVIDNTCRAVYYEVKNIKAAGWKRRERGQKGGWRWKNRKSKRL